MGGPCLIVCADGERKPAPECTDNFQIVSGKFTFNGKQWHSVEQAYQASKFASDSAQHRQIHQTAPRGRDAWSYGVDVWERGQREPVAEWNAVKLRTMLLANIAKFASSKGARKALRETGEAVIVGASSTWEWAKWNGLIMMFIRKAIVADTLSADGIGELDHDAVAGLLEGGA